MFREVNNTMPYSFKPENAYPDRFVSFTHGNNKMQVKFARVGNFGFAQICGVGDGGEAIELPEGFTLERYGSIQKPVGGVLTFTWQHGGVLKYRGDEIISFHNQWQVSYSHSKTNVRVEKTFEEMRNPHVYFNYR